MSLDLLIACETYNNYRKSQDTFTGSYDSNGQYGWYSIASNYFNNSYYTAYNIIFHI